MTRKAILLILIFCVLCLTVIFASKAIADESGPAAGKEAAPVEDPDQKLDALEWKARYYESLLTNLELVYSIKMLKTDRYIALRIGLGKTKKEINRLTDDQAASAQPETRTKTKREKEEPNR